MIGKSKILGYSRELVEGVNQRDRGLKSTREVNCETQLRWFR